MYKIAVGGAIAGAALVIMGLVSGADYSPPPTPAPVQSVLELQPANGLGPIEKSIELWSSRVEQQPLDYLSQTQLGAALITQAKEQADLAGFEDAEKALRGALSINPQHVPAKLQLTAALRSQHKFGEALSLARDIVDEEPTSPSALALAGDANFELGNYEQAEMLYAQLIDIERSAPVVSRVARLAWVQGDPELAVSLAEEAFELSSRLELRPDAEAFYSFQLGHFRFQAGDIDGAIGALTSALEIAPAHAGAAETLAGIYASTRDHTSAAGLYEQLLNAGPAADLHGSYADVLRELGDEAGAARQEALGEALALQTIEEFPAERRHLASFFLSRDPAMALDLAKADLADRQDVESYELLAWALHANGRSTDAGVAMDQALEYGTRSASFLYHAAVIAETNGEPVRARLLIEDALTLNPQFHPTEAHDAVALRDRLAEGS